MRKQLALILLISVAIANAEFIMERVDVTISDIKSDGSASVHESIKFIMYGNYSSSLYDSGITSNELSFWSTNIGLKELKFHTNPALVDISDFRLRPQPRTKCNPVQGTCHGELILDYVASPTHMENASKSPSTSGLFTIESYKPRTNRYSINPAAIAFTTTTDGSIILDKDIYFTIKLPQDSVLLDVNPRPADLSAELPAQVQSLSWNDIVLVKFSLVFDVEEGIDKEVSEFFNNIAFGTRDALIGPQGIPIIVLLAIVVGIYLYISMSKKRGEE